MRKYKLLLIIYSFIRPSHSCAFCAQNKKNLLVMKFNSTHRCAAQLFCQWINSCQFIHSHTYTCIYVYVMYVHYLFKIIIFYIGILCIIYCLANRIESEHKHSRRGRTRFFHSHSSGMSLFERKAHNKFIYDYLFKNYNVRWLFNYNCMRWHRSMGTIALQSSNICASSKLSRFSVAF